MEGTVARQRGGWRVSICHPSHHGRRSTGCSHETVLRTATAFKVRRSANKQATTIVVPHDLRFWQLTFGPRVGLGTAPASDGARRIRGGPQSGRLSHAHATGRGAALGALWAAAPPCDPLANVAR
jgi:hypothetical protein